MRYYWQLEFAWLLLYMVFDTIYIEGNLNWSHEIKKLMLEYFILTVMQVVEAKGYYGVQ